MENPIVGLSPTLYFCAQRKLSPGAFCICGEGSKPLERISPIHIYTGLKAVAQLPGSLGNQRLMRLSAGVNKKNIIKMFSDLLSQVYKASDNGLDIIKSVCPQAADAVGNRRNFKLRTEERTASAHL